jgi:hypothetical protein
MAGAAVFHIVELLEGILLYLPPIEVVRGYRVARHWGAIVAGSQKLQTHLWLKPITIVTCASTRIKTCWELLAEQKYLEHHGVPYRPRPTTEPGGSGYKPDQNLEFSLQSKTYAINPHAV